MSKINNGMGICRSGKVSCGINGDIIFYVWTIKLLKNIVFG